MPPPVFGRLAFVGGTHPLARKSVPYGRSFVFLVGGTLPSAMDVRRICLSANVACGDRTAASRPYAVIGSFAFVAPHPPFGHLMLRLPFPAA